MLDSVFFFLKPKEEVSFFFSNLSVQDGLEFLKSHTYTIMPVISPEGEYLGSTRRKPSRIRRLIIYPYKIIRC